MKSLGYRIIMWITNGDIHGIRHKCTNTPTHTRMMNFHHSPLISASKDVEYFPNWWRFAFVYTLRRCPWRIYAAAAAAEFDMAPVYFCKHFYIYICFAYGEGSKLGVVFQPVYWLMTAKNSRRTCRVEAETVLRGTSGSCFACKQFGRRTAKLVYLCSARALCSAATVAEDVDDGRESMQKILVWCIVCTAPVWYDAEHSSRRRDGCKWWATRDGFRGAGGRSLVVLYIVCKLNCEISVDRQVDDGWLHM